MPAVLVAYVLSLVSWFHQPSLDQRMQRVEASIVRVSQGSMDDPSGRRICTGSVLQTGADGRILTAAHCIGDGMLVDEAPATVLRIDGNLDLAVLVAPTSKPAIPWSAQKVHRFDQVVGLGYGDGLPAIVALLRRVVFVSLAPALIAPKGILVGPGWIRGMSGGPVVDRAGRVVGIVQRTDEANLLGYGVPTATIREFLAAPEPTPLAPPAPSVYPATTE